MEVNLLINRFNPLDNISVGSIRIRAFKPIPFPRGTRRELVEYKNVRGSPYASGPGTPGWTKNHIYDIDINMNKYRSLCEIPS